MPSKIKPKKANIFIPSDFITSERYYQARITTAMPYDDIEHYSLKRWFLEKENTKYLIHQLYKVYMKNDYKYENDPLEYTYFTENVPRWMKEWADKERISRYTEAPVEVNPYGRSDTIYRYFMLALSKMNQVFFGKYYYIIKKIDIDENVGMTGKPDWNPYKAYANIANKNEFEDTNQRVKLEDLVYSVENTRNMDVWGHKEVLRSNRNFRYGNKIPVWQAAGTSNRGWGLDRSNDGLHDGNPDRASLENQIHGYILGDITGDPKRSIYNLTNLQWPEEKGVMAGDQYFDEANYQPDTTDYYADQFPYDK